MAGEVTFTRNEDDFIAAQKEWWRASFRQPKTWRVWAFAAFMAFLAGASIWGEGTGSVSGWLYYGVVGLALAVAAILLMLGLQYALIPHKAGKIFDQTASYGRPSILRWNDAGYDEEAVNGSVKFGWADYRAWRDGRNVILLYHNDMLFQYLPHRVLSDDKLADFRETLARHGPPRR